MNTAYDVTHFSECMQRCNVEVQRHLECNGVSWAAKSSSSNCVLHRQATPIVPYTSETWTNSYQCYVKGITNTDNNDLE